MEALPHLRPLSRLAGEGWPSADGRGKGSFPTAYAMGHVLTALAGLPNGLAVLINELLLQGTSRKSFFTCHSSLLFWSPGQQIKKALLDFLELRFECQVGGAQFRFQHTAPRPQRGIAHQFRKRL